MRTVAVIGIGALGDPVARRLHDAGLDLMVCDRRGEALAPFEAIGARCTTDPRDCVTADLVILLVATPEQASQVVLGEHGLTAGLQDGHRPLLAVMSTVSADVVRELDSAASPHGLHVLDVPVSGGAHRALAGTLTVMVAGNAADKNAARPTLSHLGQVFDCGTLGNAQVLKLLNNVICAANFAITGEVYSLARQLGLQISDLTPVLDVSTGRNFLSEDPKGAVAFLQEWTRSPEAFASTCSIMLKDVALATSMAAKTATGTFTGMVGLGRLLAELGEGSYEQWRTAAGDPPPAR